MPPDFITLIPLLLSVASVGFSLGRLTKKTIVIKDEESFENGFRDGKKIGHVAGYEYGVKDGEEKARSRLKGELIEWMNAGIASLNGDNQQ